MYERTWPTFCVYIVLTFFRYDLTPISGAAYVRKNLADFLRIHRLNFPQIRSLVNILATDPVSFPTPTVEGTCFLPQFFARACGLGEELISICTKIGAQRQKFWVFPSQKLQNELNWEELSKSREEIWEIGEIFHCQMKFFGGEELFSSPIFQDS